MCNWICYSHLKELSVLTLNPNTNTTAMLLFYTGLQCLFTVREGVVGLYGRNDSSFTATPAVITTPCIVNKRRNILLHQTTPHLTPFSVIERLLLEQKIVFLMFYCDSCFVRSAAHWLTVGAAINWVTWCQKNHMTNVKPKKILINFFKQIPFLLSLI